MFLSGLTEGERADPLTSYYWRLLSDDSQVRSAAVGGSAVDVASSRMIPLQFATALSDLIVQNKFIFLVIPQ